jgi:hypothetical protein
MMRTDWNSFRVRDIANLLQMNDGFDAYPDFESDTQGNSASVFRRANYGSPGKPEPTGRRR